MKVLAFCPDYNPKHCLILDAITKGIPGAEIRPLKNYEECDVAIIFGGVKKAYPPTWDKQVILDNHEGRRLLMVESAFINRGKYWQMGWGGVAGHADFNTDPHTPLDRWYGLQVESRPWQHRPDGPIVVCGQLPRDTQVQDMDHNAWCRETVDYYAAKGEYVIFRPHPKVTSPRDYAVPDKYIDVSPLSHVLDIARCFVTWNSTSGVDAAVAGVPVVALDPSSATYEVAGRTLDDIDYTPPRHEWFAKIGYSQWTLDEMQQGKPWKHLTS